MKIRAWRMALALWVSRSKAIGNKQNTTNCINKGYSVGFMNAL